jgi:hypothetical protein
MKLGRFLAERRLSQEAFAAEVGVTRVSGATVRTACSLLAGVG